MPFSPAPVQQDFFSFDGGLNLTTPALRVPSGNLVGSLNYEPGVMGGYTRIKGYERFDGRLQPHKATYRVIGVQYTNSANVGDTVTIGSFTGVFLLNVGGGVVVGEPSSMASIPGNTQVLVNGSPWSVTNANSTVSFPITADLDSFYRVAAANYRRSLIQAVPGSGPVRGVFVYGNDVLAFRNNAGGTACVMHRATSSGWVAQTFGEEVAFSNANVNVGEGDTLTQGGVTATIRRVVVETGSLLSGTNTGRLIISGRSGGNFAAGAATSTGSGALTLSGAQTAITLPPGGRYRFIEWNFFGQQATERLYFVNGVGRACEWDGTTLTPISSGLPLADDKPAHIAANSTYLFLGINASVLYSSPGEPYVFNATLGGGEIAVGTNVRGLLSLTGATLAIFGESRNQVLVGATDTEFALQNSPGSLGATENSMAVITDGHFLGTQGISDMSATLAYGDFQLTSMSRLIQPLIDGIDRSTVVGATAHRAKNQYRLFYGTNKVLVMKADRRAPAFTTCELGITPFTVCCESDATGLERVLVGAQDGFVYEMDVGSTFDGAAIESYLKLAYNNTSSPRLRKRYRKGVIEMTAESYCSLRVSADFSYGDTGIQEHQYAVPDVVGSGGIWDVSNWDSFTYDVQFVASPEVGLVGTGVNMSLTFYSNTTLDFGHTLQGMILHYSPRRLER